MSLDVAMPFKGLSSLDKSLTPLARKMAPMRFATSWLLRKTESQERQLFPPAQSFVDQ